MLSNENVVAGLLSRPWSRARLTSFALVCFVFVLLLVFASQRWAISESERLGMNAAREMERTHSGLLASELQKYGLLPAVLTEYPDVRSVLTADLSAVERLNSKLELLAKNTQAAAIYVLDRNGRAVAASNWRLPISFVGHDYSYRSYFRHAMQNGHAEEHGLGVVSQQPGLFLAQRIADADVLGVIVVKVEFDALEAVWRLQPGLTYVTDADGIVLLSSRPELRFSATQPLTAEVRERLRRDQQFGASPLTPWPLHAVAGARVVDQSGRAYISASAAAPIPGWRLGYLAPLEQLERAAFARTRELLIVIGMMLVLVFVVAMRSYEKRMLKAETHRQLEREVERRTGELLTANEQLRIESGERERAAQRLREARDELAQANRLGTIGQITAGVAHEMNQPVAAIRTFAENAIKLLARDEIGRTRDNLETIVELTARIGRITAELRSFARRGTPVVGAVSLESAIGGAMLLMGERLRLSGVSLDYSGASAQVIVTADRVRLEQVLVNLLQNALDALQNTAKPHIRIDIATADDVVVTIMDNGPGISPGIADQIFTPFVTEKPKGLGLGLGIARDIAREFGGDLVLQNTVSGAAFALRLKRP